MSNAQIQKYSMTAKQFKENIASIPDEWTMVFAVEGTPLQFYQTKVRGEALIQLEFSATEEYPLKSRS